VADVAPLLEYGRFTGDLAWITDDGTVGWSRHDQRTRVPNVAGGSIRQRYATRLEPMESQAFVAVNENAATVLHPLADGVRNDLKTMQRIGLAPVASRLNASNAQRPGLPCGGPKPAHMSCDVLIFVEESTDAVLLDLADPGRRAAGEWS
jgi:hypothetical protein